MHLRTIAGFSDELLKIASKELTLKIPTTRGEFHEGYRKVRKPAYHAARGALIGSLLANVVTGGRAKGWRGYRLPALAGAGVGTADYLAMGKKKRKPKTKKAMMGSVTFTPARSLSQARATSRFQDKVIHKGERLRPPTIKNVAVPHPV